MTMDGTEAATAEATGDAGKSGTSPVALKAMKLPEDNPWTEVGAFGSGLVVLDS
jgi:hypothetical protein